MAELISVAGNAVLQIREDTRSRRVQVAGNTDPCHWRIRDRDLELIRLTVTRRLGRSAQFRIDGEFDRELIGELYRSVVRRLGISFGVTVRNDLWFAGNLYTMARYPLAGQTPPAKEEWVYLPTILCFGPTGVTCLGAGRRRHPEEMLCLAMLYVLDEDDGSVGKFLVTTKSTGETEEAWGKTSVVLRHEERRSVVISSAGFASCELELTCIGGLDARFIVRLGPEGCSVEKE
jgi:hypothetical protein